MQVFSSGSKDASIIDQELTFDSKNAIHILDALPKSVDIGNYAFVLEIVLHDPEHKKIYATGGRTKVAIFVTGIIRVENAKIAVLDSDLGSVETQKKLNLAGENSVALSANHLQKLRLSFQLSTHLGHAFNPHQVFLKSTHETKVDHIFMVGSSGKQFEIVLDFLGLVEKIFSLSGRYDIQLTGEMLSLENSFLQALGNVELDLPKAPEKAIRPPPQPINPYLRYGPKAEITHIFRIPDKHPPREPSLAFLGLLLLPFMGFLVGLLRLGTNMKNFLTSAVPATFAILFHVGIGAVLLLTICSFLVEVGHFHNVESTWIPGAPDSFPPCLNFSQVKIYLRKRETIILRPSVVSRVYLEEGGTVSCTVLILFCCRKLHNHTITDFGRHHRFYFHDKLY